MLFFFPRGVLDEILNLIESVSGGFPSYFWVTRGLRLTAIVCFTAPATKNQTDLVGKANILFIYHLKLH